MAEDKNLRFEVEKEILILSIENGWSKELNLVSWNGREAKFDIRSWKNDRNSVKRGVTLTDSELMAILDAKDILLDLLKKRGRI